jgi:dihydrofolate synthase/folylpolyglutamate synthase
VACSKLNCPAASRCLPGRPAIVLDVAHNPQAARTLADNLGAQGQAYYRHTIAVFGMMRDKDIDGVLDALRDRVKHWLPCTLPGPRAASAAELAERLQQRGLSAHTTCDTPAAALHLAQEIAGEDDRILVFGSFLTVAAVMQETACTFGPLKRNRHGL